MKQYAVYYKNDGRELSKPTGNVQNVIKDLERLSQWFSNLDIAEVRAELKLIRGEVG